MRQGISNTVRDIINNHGLEIQTLTWRHNPTRWLTSRVLDDELVEIFFSRKDQLSRYFRSMIMVDVLNKKDIVDIGSGCSDMANEYIAVELIKAFPSEVVIFGNFTPWNSKTTTWSFGSFVILSYKDITSAKFETMGEIFYDLETYKTIEYRLGTMKIHFDIDNDSDISSYREILNLIFIESYNLIDSTNQVRTVKLDNRNLVLGK